MANSIKEQLKLLVNLQRIEINARRYEKKLDTIPADLNELDSELIKRHNALKREDEKLKDTKKKYRQSEADLQLNLTQIAKSKQKLSSIKNNKEYQSALKEIDELEKINDSLETGMIEALELIEKEEILVGEKNKEFDLLEKDFELRKKEIKSKEDDIHLKLSEIEDERKDMIKFISEDILKKYMYVKINFGPIAIAGAEDAVCFGCHMNIPPQLYNELQRTDSLKYCPNCQRIIYWEQINS